MIAKTRIWINSTQLFEWFWFWLSAGEGSRPCLTKHETQKDDNDATSCATNNLTRLSSGFQEEPTLDYLKRSSKENDDVESDNTSTIEAAEHRESILSYSSDSSPQYFSALEDGFTSEGIRALMQGYQLYFTKNSVRDWLHRNNFILLVYR